VDVVLELLEKAGDFVSEDVWHRVVQLVTNNPAMQQYAARNVAKVLERGATHEVGARDGGRVCWQGCRLAPAAVLVCVVLLAATFICLLPEPRAGCSNEEGVVCFML
jgi:AP-2 complex subunit alpha